jgi:cytochrome c-type biogenesis protein CcmF
VFFSLMIASVANPFAPVRPVPLDGPGPHPLLQNHWLMAYHPPTLYLGYVGMAVPFSMCCAALLQGRLDAGWITPLRRWLLLPWTFLTVGIVMGGWWSYEVLGWGGYWAWDPVENASFMPWLTGTAFLHSAMLLQRRGVLRTWTLALGMGTFLLTLLGTFMTRSGVFNSVHSFTESRIGVPFLWFIALVATVSIVLLATREHLLDEPTDKAVRTWSFSPFGREFALLLQNAAFSVFTFTVLFGVLYPLIVDRLTQRKVSVGEPYFDRMALPIGMLIVFLMGVGPALPWGRVSREAFLSRFVGPTACGLATAGMCFAVGIHRPYVLLALGLCAFALWANLGEFAEPVLARRRLKKENLGVAALRVFQHGRRRFGGHVAHVGVVVAVVAIAFSSAYKFERDVVLHPGESATIGSWTAIYEGARTDLAAHRKSEVAVFRVLRDGKDVGIAEPRLNIYPQMPEPVGTPAVRSTPSGDFYLSLLQVSDKGSISMRIMVMPAVGWLWVAPLFIVAGSILALWPSRKAQPAPVAASSALVEPAG